MRATEHSETLFPAFARQFPRKVWSSLNLFFLGKFFNQIGQLDRENWTGDPGGGNGSKSFSWLSDNDKKIYPPPPSRQTLASKYRTLNGKRPDETSGLWPQTKTLGIRGDLFVGGWGGKNDRGAVVQFCAQSLSLKKKAERGY